MSALPDFLNLKRTPRQPRRTMEHRFSDDDGGHALLDDPTGQTVPQEGVAPPNPLQEIVRAVMEKRAAANATPPVQTNTMGAETQPPITPSASVLPFKFERKRSVRRWMSGCRMAARWTRRRRKPPRNRPELESSPPR